MNYKHLIVTGLFLLSSASFANDSTFGFYNNGIVYVPEERIALEKETLFLSREKIKVDYVFKNLTDEDVTVDLAFPVATCFRCYDGSASLPARSSLEEQAMFTTIINGEQAQTTQQFRAVKDGVDVSSQLEALGFEVSPMPFEGTDSQFMFMSDAQKSRLVNAGLLDSDGIPNWDVEEVYLWRATFSAGELTHVLHEYAPSISSEFYYTGIKKQFPDVCIDSDFEKSTAGSDEAISGLAMELAYLLGPGRNWAGPIGELHVIVDKTDPNHLVSLCGNGVSKTAPTRFEYSYKNYEPKQDEVMTVLFVEKYDQ